MWNRVSSPRSAQTTIPCEQCGEPLTVARTCHMAYLRCEHCKKDFRIQEYLDSMDPTMEAFLEALNCDRV